MIKNTRTLILALSAAVALPLAAATDTTDPVGYTTHVLAADGVTFMGLNMAKPVEFEGEATVSGSVLTVTSGDVSAFGGDTYWVEIVDGSFAGENHTIATATATTLDVGVPIASSGTVQIKVREHWTIGEVFGNTIGVDLKVTEGANANSADNLQLPGISGFFYYADTIFSDGWRLTGAGSADQAGQIIPLTDSVKVIRKARPGDSTFKLAGAVKVGPTIVVLQEGANFISNIVPVGTETLGNSGLFDGIGAPTGIREGANANAADNVSIPGISGFFYFADTIFSDGWRLTGAGSSDQAGQALPLDGGYRVIIKNNDSLVDESRSATLTPSF